MSDVNSYKKHIVHIGKRYSPCGQVANYYAPISRLKDHMSAPVEIQGQQQTLYFENFRCRDRVVNWQATNLFNRYGFFIHGAAVVVERTERWHCLRICGSKTNIDAEIAHVTFKDTYAVVPTSRRGNYHDVIARDEADIIALKMAI